jgi:hypothetical protein
MRLNEIELTANIDVVLKGFLSLLRSTTDNIDVSTPESFMEDKLVLVGIVDCVLAYYARGRSFNPSTIQIFVCNNMFELSRCFLCIICIYKKKSQTNLSAYYGLDNRGCKEYLIFCAQILLSICDVYT